VASLDSYEILTNLVDAVKSPCVKINPLNAKLNPICYQPALLGAHRILHVSRSLTLASPMSS